MAPSSIPSHPPQWVVFAGQTRMGKDMGHLGVMPVLRTDLFLPVKAMQMPFGIIRYLLPPPYLLISVPQEQPLSTRRLWQSASPSCSWARCPNLAGCRCSGTCWWQTSGRKGDPQSVPRGHRGLLPTLRGQCNAKGGHSRGCTRSGANISQAGGNTWLVFREGTAGTQHPGDQAPLPYSPHPRRMETAEAAWGFAVLQYNPEESTRDTKPQENQ